MKLLGTNSDYYPISKFLLQGFFLTALIPKGVLSLHFLIKMCNLFISFCEWGEGRTKRDREGTHLFGKDRREMLPLLVVASQIFYRELYSTSCMQTISQCCFSKSKTDVQHSKQMVQHSKHVFSISYKADAR